MDEGLERFKISVIVPIYNAEACLRRCVDSIIGQSHRNLEIILVDDGSTDGSPQICGAYAGSDSRVRTVRMENGGAGRARNAGLDACSGDYIGFVDSDDWVLPEMYGNMLRIAVKGGADIVECSYGIVGADGARRRGFEARGMAMDGAGALREFVAGGEIMPAVWNKLYLRALFDGIRFPPMIIAEDAFTMKYLLGGSRRVISSAESLYVVCLKPGSLSRSAITAEKLRAYEAHFTELGAYAQERLRGPEDYASWIPLAAYANMMLRMCVAGAGRFGEMYGEFHGKLARCRKMAGARPAFIGAKLRFRIAAAYRCPSLLRLLGHMVTPARRAKALAARNVKLLAGGRR
ncbi:MAG: glycosyltransferase [Clostridiales Family XIII bacterium]|jgi:glycosyltransferase involved in cell wall biosynthesis|nr:glycosyltransferase [Clostridiales Family XIII bacterium]